MKDKGIKTVEQYYIKELDMITYRTIGIIKLAHAFNINDVACDTFKSYKEFYSEFTYFCLKCNYIDLVNRLNECFTLVKDAYFEEV